MSDPTTREPQGDKCDYCIRHLYDRMWHENNLLDEFRQGVVQIIFWRDKGATDTQTVDAIEKLHRRIRKQL